MMVRQVDRQAVAYNNNCSAMKSATLLFITVTCLISSSSARRKAPRQPTAARSGTSEPRSTENDPCYMGDDGSATRCIPDFINAAYGREIVASSTCGQPPVNFCSQLPAIVYQQQQLERYSNRNKSRDDDDDDDIQGLRLQRQASCTKGSRYWCSASMLSFRTTVCRPLTVRLGDRSLPTFLFFI